MTELVPVNGTLHSIFTRFSFSFRLLQEGAFVISHESSCVLVINQ